MDDPTASTAPLKRYALIAAGTICVALGAVGVFVPLLPTTPFLLLAAACYIRSSPRLYQRLIRNRILGRYISGYRSGEGIPAGAKVVSLCLLWAAIGYCATFVVKTLAVRILLLLIAIGVTAHIIAIRTSKH